MACWACGATSRASRSRPISRPRMAEFSRVYNKSNAILSAVAGILPGVYLFCRIREGAGGCQTGQRPGTLTQKPGQGPTLETASHQTIFLSGDEGTMKVLNDPRVRGFDLEAKGHFTAPDKFQVDPLYTKAMFVHKDGHLKVITYWCDTCSIRTYAPGPCWCCQQETTLDLRDPDAYKNDK